eukprot:scaffold776_cov347-Pavlova_lutheri.AAC.122
MAQRKAGGKKRRHHRPAHPREKRGGKVPLQSWIHRGQAQIPQRIHQSCCQAPCPENEHGPATLPGSQ